MTPTGAKTGRAAVAIEFALSAAVLIALLVCLMRALGLGYLPAPFFYDPSHTFMDWYDVAYWGRHAGAYDIARIIYPPFSLVFTNLFGDPRCYVSDPLLARNCDVPGKVALFLSYAACVAVVFGSYWRADRKTAIVRTIALALGFPMLCALDLGNLVVPACLCFALGYGGLLRSARWEWLAIALSINFKPYLIVTLLPRLLRRHWSWLAGCAAVGLAVYVISYVILGSGAPLQILLNDYMWSKGNFRDTYEAFYSGSSYTSMLRLFTFSPDIRLVLGETSASLLMMVGWLTMRVGQIGVVALLIAAAVGKARVPRYRLVALCLSLALASVELEVYGAVFLVFLVFLEKWREPGAIVALVAAYLLCIPGDMSIAVLDHWRVFSYLGNRTVTVPLGLNVGSLIRPGLILVMQYGLIAATVCGALRRQDQLAVPQAIPAA